MLCSLGVEAVDMGKAAGFQAFQGILDKKWTG